MTNPQNPYGNNDSNLPSYGDSSASQPGAHSAEGQAAGNQTPRFPGTGGDAGYAGDGAGYSAYNIGTDGQGAFQQEDPKLHKKSVLAIFVLLVGLVALLTGPMVLGFAVGLFGILLGIIALIRNRKKVGKARRTWMTVVGIILSVIGIVLAFVVTRAVMQSPEIQNCMYDASGNLRAPEDVQACINDLGEALQNQ